MSPKHRETIGYLSVAVAVVLGVVLGLTIGTTAGEVVAGALGGTGFIAIGQAFYDEREETQRLAELEQEAEVARQRDDDARERQATREQQAKDRRARQEEAEWERARSEVVAMTLPEAADKLRELLQRANFAVLRCTTWGSHDPEVDVDLVALARTTGTNTFTFYVNRVAGFPDDVQRGAEASGAVLLDGPQFTRWLTGRGRLALTHERRPVIIRDGDGESTG